MVLFSFPLCIVDCVIFCENSTNWSFFFLLFFFFCCYLPLIDMNKQLQDIFISVSPSFFFVYVFPTDWWKKSTHWKTNNESWYTFQKDERWVIEKKWLITIKNFVNFLLIFNSFFLFSFFTYLFYHLPYARHYNMWLVYCYPIFQCGL
jgi:hypothetical protein